MFQNPEIAKLFQIVELKRYLGGFVFDTRIIIQSMDILAQHIAIVQFQCLWVATELQPYVMYVCQGHNDN